MDVEYAHVPTATTTTTTATLQQQQQQQQQHNVSIKSTCNNKLNASI
jgi:hypothetical protein